MSTSKHPKGLYLVFATSTAERFSYYGMRAIFILFLTQALLFDTEAAASIYDITIHYIISVCIIIWTYIIITLLSYGELYFEHINPFHIKPCLLYTSRCV